MKSTLEFNLPEDRDEHMRAVLADRMCSVLWETNYEIFRKRLRYDDLSEECHKVVESMRDEFIELLDDAGLNLDELWR